MFDIIVKKTEVYENTEFRMIRIRERKRCNNSIFFFYHPEIFPTFRFTIMTSLCESSSLLHLQATDPITFIYRRWRFIIARFSRSDGEIHHSRRAVETKQIDLRSCKRHDGPSLAPAEFIIINYINAR